MELLLSRACNLRRHGDSTKHACLHTTRAPTCRRRPGNRRGFPSDIQVVVGCNTIFSFFQTNRTPNCTFLLRNRMVASLSSRNAQTASDNTMHGGLYPYVESSRGKRMERWSWTSNRRTSTGNTILASAVTNPPNVVPNCPRGIRKWSLSSLSLLKCSL